ncbi:hypothetical protein ACFE04_026616 [Oxalis oulophora]
MSRCYPFPPPGYVKNAIPDDKPLNELNNVVKVDTKAAKKERKEEKKREKREKRKSKESGGDVESKKHKHKKRKHSEEKSHKDDIDLAYEKKLRQNELDCLEKSSLTEELGQAVGSQNSTDSTLKSTIKRQKLVTSPPDVSQSSGSKIRIKLSIQRQKDPEVLPDEPSSSLGRTPDVTVRGNVGPETIRHDKSKPLLSADVSKLPTHKSGATPPSNLCSRCPPEFSLRYKDLFENWAPPPLELNDTELDESWLFETKKKHDKKACDTSTSAVGFAHSSGPYPRAICLPGADIYALPGADIYALPYVLPY